MSKEIKQACQRKAYSANRKRRTMTPDDEWTDIQPQPKLTWQDVHNVMTSAEGKCYWCGAEVWTKGTLEHLTRVFDGGTNDRSNLAWACLPCNQKGYYREASNRGIIIPLADSAGRQQRCLETQHKNSQTT